MLGGLQIRALRRELVESKKMTDRQFHDAILKENSIPVDLIRASLDRSTAVARLQIDVAVLRVGRYPAVPVGRSIRQATVQETRQVIFAPVLIRFLESFGRIFVLDMRTLRCAQKQAGAEPAFLVVFLANAQAATLSVSRLRAAAYRFLVDRRAVLRPAFLVERLAVFFLAAFLWLASDSAPLCQRPIIVAMFLPTGACTGSRISVVRSHLRSRPHSVICRAIDGFTMNCAHWSKFCANASIGIWRFQRRTSTKCIAKLSRCTQPNRDSCRDERWSIDSHSDLR